MYYLGKLLLVVFDFSKQLITILLTEFDGLHSGYEMSVADAEKLRISQINQNQ